MKRIGLMSDTHSYLDPNIFKYFEDCDEIWHAGDIGDYDLVESLEDFKKFRAVYGNIDDHSIRAAFPLNLQFQIEGLNVFMTHIGGYPGRYKQGVQDILLDVKPDLYICGHSHICKIMPDKSLNLLHMNPGACGHHGFHAIRTIIRFTISSGKMSDVEVIELGRRGVLHEASD